LIQSSFSGTLKQDKPQTSMEKDSPQQDAILRRMTPGQKLRVAESLYWQARAWKVASLKMLHPDWPEDRIKREVREQFSHGTTG
jgi:hypothetical protein